MTTPGYGDLPATHDELGFTPSAEALATIVQGADLADTPLTVGIYGPWGSGKTSMMQMMYRLLSDPTKPQPEVLPIWFDAWRYAQNDVLWRALLVSIVEEIRIRVLDDPERLRTLVTRQALRQGADIPSNAQAERPALEQRLDDLIASLYRNVEREELGSIQIDWPEAGKASARTAIRLGLAAIPLVGPVVNGLDEAIKSAQGGAATGEDVDSLTRAIRRERSKIYSEQVRSLEQFYQQFKALLEEWADLAGYRLVVFIDDLDRCLPEQAIGVLEAIKVFLDVRGCIFVLGVDREIIERGIRVRYKEFALSASAAGPFPVAERDYLEKIVQVPFTLPPLAPVAITAFLQRRLPNIDGMSDADRVQVAALMTAGLLRNPRKVKRSFNIFRLHQTLDRAYGRSTVPGLIAKLTVIQTSFADLYERIARDPLVLRQVEQVVRGTPGAGAISQELRDEIGKSDPRLKEMLYMPPFFDTLDDDKLRELVYQSRVTVETSSAGV